MGVKFKEMGVGSFGLILLQSDGVIAQIGLTEEQSSLLNAFLSAMSNDSKLLKLPKEYNLKIVDK